MSEESRDLVHETLHFEQRVAAPLEDVWAAFADTGARTRWGVPAGEEQVYDHDDLRTDGSASYRCGEPGVLSFHGDVAYLDVEQAARVVHTDIVRTEGQLLAVALLTWEFRDEGDACTVALVDQVTSFVGTGMIDGHRNGHAAALAQLAGFVESR